MSRDDEAIPEPDGDWSRVALASIGDAVVTTDASGRVTFLNAVAERLTGWSGAEARGQPLPEVFRIVREETGEPAPDPAERALREGVVVGLANHTSLVARDGTVRPIDDSAAPVRGDDGRVLGVVLVFRDVSERRAAELALAESEERFRLLVDGTRDYAIFLLDREGRVASWNPGAELIKGWRANEIVGRHFSVFYPPEVAAAGWPAEELRRASETGRCEDEGWRVRRDGTRFWANVVITALRDEHGRLRGFSKITRDLTERRLADEAVRAGEERFRTLTESATDPIVVADADGVVTFANGAAVRAFGWSAEELVGRPLTVLMPERYRGPHAAGIARLRAGGPSRLLGRTVEVDGLRRDGSEFPVELSLSTWVTERGRSFCGILRDVTERRLLERAHAQAAAMADLDRRKDEFLAMLSHELRNPLAPILNAVHLLRTEAADAAVREQAGTIIERQVGQLTRLVDDLLEVSRIITGRMQLQRAPVDLRAPVERAVESVRPLVAERGHTLRLALPGVPVPARVDAARVEQAVVNLLTNAVKYTDEGGRIGIVLRSERDAAVLTVRDTGVGIPPELLPHVFGLFTQGERSLDRSQGGLGIGLTIVRRLVEMHGGTVEARSDGPGRGSEFVVRIPTGDGADAEPAAAPAAADAPAAGAAVPPAPMRLLVVDDNHDACDSTALLLRRLGHRVETAYDGPAALAAIRTSAPDAVLLDIGLPGMDGYEVARRVRAEPSLAGVKLVAVTGYGQEEDLERSRRAGFDAHLVKPVEPRDVLAALDGRLP